MGRNSAKSRAKKGTQAMGTTGAEAWGMTQRGCPSALLSPFSHPGQHHAPLVPHSLLLELLGFVVHLRSPFNHRFPGPENESQLQKHGAPGTGHLAWGWHD